jgi:4-hydroxy-3-methylbut-2-enyl diphosphate reductase
MKIIRANYSGMCFGVRDAIALAQKAAAAGPLTVLGDLVHNETVMEDLRGRGIQFQSALDDSAATTVMITAHGASDRVRDQIRQRGYNLLEATCPLVRMAHESVVKLAANGFHPVIIGRRDHVEVRGLTGDLKEFDVVLNEADVMALPERPRFGVAAQTTQPIEKVNALVALLRQRFPQSHVRFVDTVCRPTKQRQAAAMALARQSDVVLVIGGAQSNNTHELVATCRKHCARVHHVQGAADLRREWFEGVDTVGLTAGTSTPDATIAEVEQQISEFGQLKK